MLLTSLLSLALTANAFLIPGDLEDFSAKGLAHPAVSQQQQEAKTLTLDCSTCPYALKAERNGQYGWTDDVSSDLEMEISSDGDTLSLNGVSFYPITVPGPPPPLRLSQHKKEGETSTLEGYEGDLTLSYSLEYDEKKFEDGNTLITVLMTVMGLDGHMVRVDNVEIKAIRDAEGKLILHSVVAVPADPNSPDAKCGNLLCRVLTKVSTSIQKAKDTAKAAGHRIKCFCVKCFQRLTGHASIHHNGPEAHRRPDGTIELPTHFKFPPQMRKPHTHGHHHKGIFHRMARVLWATVKIGFVPMLIGIAFGMTASAVGMLVGQLVVFLWMKYRKMDDQGAYDLLEADEKEVPPPYEDVPTAGNVGDKEVEAKA
ncbi:MAG: hypothetical protein Q9163_006347 [Psora crenata]